MRRPVGSPEPESTGSSAEQEPARPGAGRALALPAPMLARTPMLEVTSTERNRPPRLELTGIGDLRALRAERSQLQATGRSGRALAGALRLPRQVQSAPPRSRPSNAPKTTATRQQTRLPGPASSDITTGGCALAFADLALPPKPFQWDPPFDGAGKWGKLTHTYPNNHAVSSCADSMASPGSGDRALLHGLGKRADQGPTLQHRIDLLASPAAHEAPSPATPLLFELVDVHSADAGILRCRYLGAIDDGVVVEQAEYRGEHRDLLRGNIRGTTRGLHREERALESASHLRTAWRPKNTCQEDTPECMPWELRGVRCTLQPGVSQWRPASGPLGPSTVIEWRIKRATTNAPPPKLGRNTP